MLPIVMPNVRGRMILTASSARTSGSRVSDAGHASWAVPRRSRATLPRPDGWRCSCDVLLGNETDRTEHHPDRFRRQRGPARHCRPSPACSGSRRAVHRVMHSRTCQTARAEKTDAASASGRDGGRTRKYPRGVTTGASTSFTSWPVVTSSSTSGVQPSATPSPISAAWITSA